jgi:O-antigen ligase
MLSTIGLSIIVMPFNALPYLKSILHDMSHEASFYPTLIGLLLWFAYLCLKRRIFIPNRKNFHLFVIFVFWIFISTALNSPNISYMIFKGRSAISKNILQIIMFLYMAFVALYIYNVFIMKGISPLKYIRTFVMVSFLIAGFYSIFEILKMFGLNDGGVLVAIDHFIREGSNPYFVRLRSVSQEPSWFAMYCGFAFPWIFSYIFTERAIFKRLFYILLIAYLSILIFATFSRTAYFVIIIETIIFLVLAFYNVKHREKKKMLIISICLFFVLVIGYSFVFLSQMPIINLFSSIFDFSMDNSYRLSNISRIGSQTIALKIAMSHPIFGVGFGQYGFYMSQYVSDWMLVSSEIETYSADMSNTSWAPAHGLYTRIAAELGFIGLSIWIAMLLSLIFNVYKIYRRNSLSGENDYLGLSLLVCIIGVSVSGMNMDSFRFLGYWLSLAAGWAYRHQIPGALVANS